METLLIAGRILTLPIIISYLIIKDICTLTRKTAHLCEATSRQANHKFEKIADRVF